MVPRGAGVPWVPRPDLAAVLAAGGGGDQQAAGPRQAPPALRREGRPRGESRRPRPQERRVLLQEEHQERRRPPQQHCSGGRQVLQPCQVQELKEQVRDLMFFMVAQSQVKESPLKDEVASGSVTVGEAPPPPGPGRGAICLSSQITGQI